MDPNLEAILDIPEEQIPMGYRLRMNEQRLLVLGEMRWRKIRAIANTLYGRAYIFIRLDADTNTRAGNAAAPSGSPFVVRKRTSIMDKFKILFRRKKKDDKGISSAAETAAAISNINLVSNQEEDDDNGGREEDDDTNNLVLVKRSNIERVRARVTTDGARVPEDPIMEYKILRYIEEHHSHPFIMRIEAFFRDDFDYFTIATFYNFGSLLDYLPRTQRPVLGEYEGSRIIRDVVSAVEHIHNLGIVHLDISPENIILHNFPNGEMHAVLIDFGTARCFPVGDDMCVFEMQIGKEKYMAPEMFRARNRELRAYPCDIWTIGSTLFTMLCGFNIYQFPIAARCEHFRAIFYQGLRDYATSRRRYLSEKAMDFCIACLQIDPKARSTARNLARHPLLRIGPDEDHYSVQL